MTGPGAPAVLLADRRPVVRGGLRAALATDARIAVVAEVGARHAVTPAVLARRPDVVVLDPYAGGCLGLAVIEDVHRVAPHAAVLVFSSSADGEQVRAAMRAGARGYLLTSAEPGDVVRAVLGIAAGELIFGAPVATQLTRLLAARAHPFGALTGRERQVLDLVAAGLGNPDIARRLRLAPKTVRNHVSAIFGKLGVADRAQAIARARAAGHTIG